MLLTRICLIAVSGTLLLIGPVSAGEAQSRFFDSDGVKIHFVEKGQGDPVVLIHGFAASHQMNWVLPGILDRLAEDYRVIALDNRGHGQSDKPHERSAYGLHMVDDVIRLMDHLDIPRAHVVGYSMGGFITTRLITRHPDRVASAVIGAAGWNEHPEPRFALLDAIGDSLESGNGLIPLMQALQPTDQPKVPTEQLQATSQLIMAVNDPLALSAAIRGMRELTVQRSELEQNQVPVLAVVGSSDPLREGVEELAAVMNNLELVLIDGADHLSAVRRSEFTDVILDHLKRHPLSRQAVTASRQP